MSEEIDARITPALHPGNVKALDGYDDETALVLGQTVDAFTAAYEGLKSIWAAKEAAMRDPRLNESGALLKTDAYADSVFNRITKTFDAEMARLTKAINHLEGELTQSVESKAVSSMSAEIRAHVKGLPTSERMSLIRRAIDEGDTLTASSVLGGPAYLSGLDAQMAKTLTRMFNAKQNPKLDQRHRAMSAARKLIEEHAGKCFAERDKAVGYITDPKSGRKIYPPELRKMAEAADKPFARAS